jgi:hypothetical protein
MLIKRNDFCFARADDEKQIILIANECMPVIYQARLHIIK